jgi:hypothetical protein
MRKYKKAKRVDISPSVPDTFSVSDYYRALGDNLPMTLEGREALKKSYHAYASGGRSH